MWLPVFKYLLKFAKQGMFTLPNGSPYEGNYVETSNGKFFAGDSPGDESKRLTLQENTATITQTIIETIQPEPIYPTPEDYDKGFMLRYFVKKTTSDTILEVEEAKYNEVVAKPVYRGVVVKWILEKPAKDIFNQGYLYKGAITRNKENVNIATVNFKGLNNFITEYDKFVNIESDVEGYKFEDLSREEKLRIIKRLPSTLQKSPKVKPKPRFKKRPPSKPIVSPPRTRTISGGGGGFSGYRDEGFNEEGNVGGGMGGDYGNSGQNESMSQY